METVENQMREMVLKTPERRSRNVSILSTPGLPTVETPDAGNNIEAVVPFPNSPQPGPLPVIVPHRIFVGGFPPSTTEHELRSYFERYGVVREVKIIRDDYTEETPRKKYCYGFVTFSNEQEAKNVVEMNKQANGRAFKFQGYYLNVNEAIKKPLRKPLCYGSAPVAVPQTGWVLREQNGQFVSVYPNYYAVVSQPDQYYVVPPTPPPVTAQPPPMVPMIVQSQPMYQAPLQSSIAVQPQMTYTQVAPLPSPNPGQMPSPDNINIQAPNVYCQ